MIAQIKGQIVASGINEFEKKKNIQLMILQVNGSDAEVIKVKDSEVENYHQYKSGQFDKKCNVQAWSFGERSGVSVSVITNQNEKPKESKKGVL